MKQVEHGLMDRPIACDQFLPIDRMGSAFEVRHRATGFSQNDDSSCHVPGVQCHFPKPIKPARRNIAQVQGCRSCST